MKAYKSGRLVLALFSLALAALVGGGLSALGLCGNFTDTAADAFCPFVLEIFYMGITTGTTATTYDPTGNVSRLQMAAFLSRTVDGVVKRVSRRAALRQFWINQSTNLVGIAATGVKPQLVESDGEDVWVASLSDNLVQRIHGSDGRLLETFTGATNAVGVLIVGNGVLVTGYTSPGHLYMLGGGGAANAVASDLGDLPAGITYDGLRIWTANTSGSVSIVTPLESTPWIVNTVTTGFSAPHGTLFDGANVWVTNTGAGTLLKLNASGGILQTVTVGPQPFYPVFDGTNIWVPNGNTHSISVVRASSGSVLATLTGNGLDIPIQAAFDGQRILVTNNGGGVSLWKAADLTTIGNFATFDLLPTGACSDGTSFWVTLGGDGVGAGTLQRF
ncbi:MAG TPA: S-layer homology domain-containing protein [Thermoanaerobaculia bacterium]|nr:S-layer homology domain-containing protein [Thermoanaerobaculia bacterium]